MKQVRKLFMATFGAASTLLGTASISPAQAALFNYQFQFNAQETGEPVSGNFVFDDSIKPGMTPDGGTLYGNASPEYTINAGNDVFSGSTNSIVVARDALRPDNSGLRADVIGFNDFSKFDPTNPQFLATFAYPSNSLKSDALSDLPTSLPSSGLALIKTDSGATLSSLNVTTKVTPVNVTPVPEPASTLGILTLLALSTGSVLKRKLRYKT